MLKWDAIKYQCKAYFIYEITLNLKYFRAHDPIDFLIIPVKKEKSSNEEED